MHACLKLETHEVSDTQSVEGYKQFLSAKNVWHMLMKTSFPAWFAKMSPHKTLQATMVSISSKILLRYFCGMATTSAALQMSKAHIQRATSYKGKFLDEDAACKTLGLPQDAITAAGLVMVIAVMCSNPSCDIRIQKDLLRLLVDCVDLHRQDWVLKPYRSATEAVIKVKGNCLDEKDVLRFLDRCGLWKRPHGGGIKLRVPSCGGGQTDTVVGANHGATTWRPETGCMLQHC